VIERRLELAGGGTLAWIEFGSRGRPLLALHGNFGRGRLWAPLAEAIAPRWRVLAADLPSHGHSDSPDGDWLPAAVDAVAALAATLPVPPVLAGHSIGGLVAYTLAAQRPELVAALIVVDTPASVGGIAADTEALPDRFPTFAALRAALDDPWAWESAAEFDDGWGFLFDADELSAARAAVTGDHWARWRGSRMPALLVRGIDSPRLAAGHASEMASRRMNTRLVEIRGGHSPQEDDPEAFADAVRTFLDGLG
jgi:esterase